MSSMEGRMAETMSESAAPSRSMRVREDDRTGRHGEAALPSPMAAEL